MRKIGLLAILCCLILQGFGQEAEQKSLYSLKPNEWVIHKNENRLHLTAEKTGFLFFIGHKTADDTIYFMVNNGVMFGPYDYIFDPEIGDQYEETGHYWFVFHQEGKKYFNLNGRTFGPYDEIGPWGGWYHPIIHSEHEYAFTFKRDEKEYIIVNGREFGPFDNVHDYYTTYSRDIQIWSPTAFMFRFEMEGMEFINHSGKVFGPMLGFDAYQGQFRVDGPDKISFAYHADDGMYAYVDGLTTGPFDEVKFIRRDKDGNMSFIGKNFNGSTLYYKDASYGPYDEIKYVEMKNGLTFQFRVKGHWFGHADGKTHGPWLKLSRFKAKASTVSYLVQDGDGSYTTQIGGKTYGPYDLIDGYYWAENEEGGYAFCYSQSEINYVNVNGKVIKIPGTKAKVKLFGKTNYIITYKGSDQAKKGSGWYFNVSGKTYGPYDHLGMNSFSQRTRKEFWLKYDTPDGTFVRHNNKEYGPYDRVYPAYTKQNDFFFRSYKDDQHFAFTNGKLWGPYDHVWFPDLINSTAFCYRKGDKRMTVQEDGSEIMERPDFGKYWRTIHSSNKEHRLIWSPTVNAIFVDGLKYDTHPDGAFGHIWNEQSGAFYWLEWHGRQLVQNKVVPTTNP